MTRLRRHYCDCDFCDVTEVEMTREEIAWEDEQEARREEREIEKWTPARSRGEQVHKDLTRLNRAMADQIEQEMFGLK
jgi:hypothetical protein